MRSKRMNIENVKKTKAYLAKGISYRDTAKILGTNVKQVYRWSRYDSDELSPADPLRVGSNDI